MTESTALETFEPMYCERCRLEFPPDTMLCPRCKTRLTLPWPVLLAGIALLAAGSLAAFCFAALDWFLFLAGTFVAAGIAAVRARRAERRRFGQS